MQVKHNQYWLLKISKTLTQGKLKNIQCTISRANLRTPGDTNQVKDVFCHFGRLQFVHHHARISKQHNAFGTNCMTHILTHAYIVMLYKKPNISRHGTLFGWANKKHDKLRNKQKAEPTRRRRAGKRMNERQREWCLSWPRWEANISWALSSTKWLQLQDSSPCRGQEIKQETLHLGTAENLSAMASSERKRMTICIVVIRTNGLHISQVNSSEKSQQ